MAYAKKRKWLQVDQTEFIHAVRTAIAAVASPLIARTQHPWIVAIHRFIEISLGIAGGLILTAVWPEPQQAAA